MQYIRLLLLMTVPIIACNKTSDPKPERAASKQQATQADKAAKKEINVYTHRHYEVDKEIFKDFETKTGIHINVVNAKADELLARLEREGDKSPADVFITSDVARLYRAQQKGLLQSIDSDMLKKNVPSHLRDENSQWFGLTKRARVIAYANSRVKPSEIKTYQDLANPKWKGKIAVRSSSNIYNQSLLASMIAKDDHEFVTRWAQNILSNMARSPKGNDRDQVKAVAAGVADIAIINTYYLGKLLNSKDENEKSAGEAVGLIFPEYQAVGLKEPGKAAGTHINISGAGVLKTAPHVKEAQEFLEYLTSIEVQNKFSAANYEYPVNPKAELSPLLKSWGDFKEDTLPLSNLGKYNAEAVKIFDQVGWK